MKWAITFVVFLSVGAVSQELVGSSIRGMRVVGESMHGLPIVVSGSRVRVEFDDTSHQRVDYRLRVQHCDMNGQVTDNVFVNDPLRLSMLEPIAGRPAPTGVRGYRWTYQVSFPGPKGIEEIPMSGYYRGWVVEAESGREVGTFDFVCAERQPRFGMRVQQRRVPSQIAPLNEGIAVSVVVRFSESGPGDEVFQQLSIRAVDVVKNREWSRRTRIETYDSDPNTWIENAGTEEVTYVAGAVPPGNEYRQLDIRSSDLYPRGETVHLRSGADVSRFFFPGRPDNNGSPVYVTTGPDADYELTEFQFLWEGSESSGESPSVHVVGEFNGWTVQAEWRLPFDAQRGRYALVKPLRRGRYDYQYVFEGNDWVRLEGNDWSTRNLYTAFVVYRDQRFGGFDRIIHVAQLESTGSEPTGSRSN